MSSSSNFKWNMIFPNTIATLKCLTGARGLIVMIDMASRIQILDEAVYIFLGKGMHPTILTSLIAN